MMPRLNLPRLRPTVAPRPPGPTGPRPNGTIAPEPPDQLPTKPEVGPRPKPYIAQPPPDPLPTKPELESRPYIAQPPPDQLPTEPSTLITGGEIMDITAPGINMGKRHLQDEGSKVSSSNLRRHIRKFRPSLISVKP